MKYDEKLLEEALADLYFQHLMKIRDEQIESGSIDAVVMAQLKVEMAKTGKVDGFIQKYQPP